MPFKSKEANAKWRERMRAQGIRNPYAFEQSLKNKGDGMTRHRDAYLDKRKRMS